MTRKSLVFCLVLCVFVMSIPQSFAQDDVDFPALTGPYAVGQALYHLVDDSRDELMTDDPDDVRELMAYVYYPADLPADAEPVPYLDAALREGFVAGGMWDQFFMITDMVHPHAVADAPLIGDAYPVLVFLPGLAGMPFNYTVLLEEIASQGYIVVAISPSYYGYVTAFPDGRVAYGPLNTVLDPNAVVDPVDFDQALQTWGSDAIFVLDQLEALNTTDARLTGHMNLDAVGVWGHSMGGTTALWMSQNDPRVKAAVSMDGAFVIDQACTLCRAMLNATVNPPIMVMLSARAIAIPRHKIALGYRLTMTDANHVSFSDDALVWQDPANRPQGEQMLARISAYLIAFFDTYLKGAAAPPLLEGPSPDYPEVDFELIEAAS